MNKLFLLIEPILYKIFIAIGVIGLTVFWLLGELFDMVSERLPK